MKRTCGLAGLVPVVLGAMLATGCDSGSAMQIQAQQERIIALESANSQLSADLRASRMAADAARNRAIELENDLAAARKSLADKPEPVVTQLPSKWEGQGPIVWTNVAEDILFDSGRAQIKSKGKERLREIAQQIQDNFPDRIIWVVGHTDNDPIQKTKKLWKDNLDLSQARGRTVAIELRALGLDPKDLIAGGQGEFNPIDPGDTKAAKAKNRRVQILAVARPAAAATVTNSP